MSQPEAGVASVRTLRLPGLGRRRAATRSSEADVAAALTLRALFVSRLLVWAGGFIAVAIFGTDKLAAAMYDPNRAVAPFRTSWVNFLTGPAARWDSVWYLQIAHNGYFARPTSVFFPLYPLLIHLGAAVFGSEMIVALLISLASLVIAIYLLYRLVRLDLDESATKTTILLVVFFPTALFFSAVYTESLFLMLSVGAIYAARQNRWALASVLGAFAAASRSNGVLVLVPLALIYLYGPVKLEWKLPGRTSWLPRERLAPSVLWLLLVPAGLGAYMAYLAIAHGMGAALAPFQELYYWRRSFAGPLGSVFRLFGALPHDLSRIASGHTLSVDPLDPISWTTHDLIDLGFLAFAVAGFCLAWRRVPLAYVGYAFAMLVQSLSYPSVAEPLASFSRYMLVIFPLFMGWAAWLAGRPVARRGLLMTSSALLVGFSGLFTFWGWVA